MTQKDREPGFDILSQLQEFGREEAALKWEGTFGDYLGLVTQDPILVRTAHQTLYRMILSHGVETLQNGTKKYPFFDSGPNAMYGAEKPIARLVDVFAAAASGLEPRRRILLLMGPPGSGKTTIVSALKRGMEQYSRTEEGAIYAISDCPMHEEPLHLLPPTLRGGVREQLCSAY